jgi:hypothetical protein
MAYGANHRTEQLEEAAPPRPCDNVEKETRSRVVYGAPPRPCDNAEKETRSRVVYGARHCAGQLGEIAPLQPWPNVP